MMQMSRGRCTAVDFVTMLAGVKLKILEKASWPVRLAVTWACTSVQLSVEGPGNCPSNCLFVALYV